MTAATFLLTNIPTALVTLLGEEVDVWLSWFWLEFGQRLQSEDVLPPRIFPHRSKFLLFVLYLCVNRWGRVCTYAALMTNCKTVFDRHLKNCTCQQGRNCVLVLFKVKHLLLPKQWMTRCLGFIYTCWLGWNCNMWRPPKSTRTHYELVGLKKNPLKALKRCLSPYLWYLFY